MLSNSSALTDSGFDHWTNFADQLEVSEPEKDSFCAHWDMLAPDRNYEKYTQRERRILRYFFNRTDGLTLNLDPVYQAKAQYNVPYKRGKNQLTYVTQDCIDDPLMRRILLSDLDALGEALTHDVGYSVDIHLFRVLAKNGAVSPTTSGVHQDGHEWIFMHLVNHHNIQPVVSTLHPGNAPEPVLYKAVMQGFLETLVVHDRRHFHAATEVRQSDTSIPAWRDLLLVNIDSIRAEGGN